MNWWRVNKMIGQQSIDEYVKHALYQFPNISQEQLTDMVILHFDIPDDIAKRKVGKSLEQARPDEPYHNRFTGEIM